MSLHRPNPFAHLGKAKKATPPAPQGDDDATDRADEANPARRKARTRERNRVVAIMTSEPAKRDPVLAAHMALDGDTPQTTAIETMAAMLGMEPGQKADAPAPSATAAAIIEAGRRRRGETLDSGATHNGPTKSARLTATSVAIVAAGRKRRGEA